MSDTQDSMQVARLDSSKTSRNNTLDSAIDEVPSQLEYEKPKFDRAQQFKDDPFGRQFLDIYKKLPERVDFRDLPKIEQSKRQWREGVRKLEECFQSTLNSVQRDFDQKVTVYVDLQEKIETNMRFLETFYADMQVQLNDKYRWIKEEKEEWLAEKELIKSKVKPGSEVVNLNVGGTHHFSIEKEVLRSVPGSTLSKAFSDMHDLKEIEGEIFLDRDGKTFELLANYLRNERVVYPDFSDVNQERNFLAELHYWGIDHAPNQRKDHVGPAVNLNNQIWQNTPSNHHVISGKTERVNLGQSVTKVTQAGQARRNSASKERVHIPKQNFMSRFSGSPTPSPVCYFPQYCQESHSEAKEPLRSASGSRLPTNQVKNDEDLRSNVAGAALQMVRNKWQELGPLRLEEIVANSVEVIDQSRQFGQSRFNKFIIGQVGTDGRVSGVGKEINEIIYEGQFKQDVYHGFGRYIYSNGNFYIGQWLDGKRTGWGKLVDRSGKVYEGRWLESKFIGQ